MQCPACDGALGALEVHGITVDACAAGCGGIWFDREELQKVDEAFEPEGEPLAALPALSGTPVNPARRRSCPRCDAVVMLRHFTSILRQVEVDHCPGCGGFWLDGGELARLREENREPGVRERLKAAAAELGPSAELRASSQAEIERWRGIGRIFRLLGLRARWRG